MKNLLIIGAGQHGTVVREIADKLHRYSKIDFLDDSSVKAIGRFDEFDKYRRNYADAFVALGNYELRMFWMKKLKEVGYNIPVLIDINSIVSESAKVFPGTVVESGCIINAESVIKEGCILAIGCLVDHNCLINSGVYLEAGVIVKPSTVIPEGKRVMSGFVWGNNL